MIDWSLQIEREKRRAHRQQLISEAQAMIEGADMDGLVTTVMSCSLLCNVVFHCVINAVANEPVTPNGSENQVLTRLP